MRFRTHYHHLTITLVIVLLGAGSCSRSGGENSSTEGTAAPLSDYDIPLEKPKPGEWLYAHAEKGQTFDEYKRSDPVTVAGDHATVYFQPVGDFSDIEEKIIAYTADYIHIFFGLEVTTLPTLSDKIVPAHLRRRQTEGQEQLCTKFFLEYLPQHMPDDAIVVMAITQKDLYPREDWNFVFGQASLKNRVGVSSMYRFIIDELDSLNYQVVLDRMIKTSSHEIGHMFTCQHCIHALCVMNGSNSLRETDLIPARLCSECVEKLSWNLKFDVLERADQLQAYFYRHRIHYAYQAARKDWELLKRLQ